MIACSVNDALEVQRGGAGRIELVREMNRGGLTPPLDLVEDVMGAVTIPVRVMLREADGYGAGDVDRLVRLAAPLAALGVDGVVVGFLRGRCVDVAAMDAALGAASPARGTFHHAFDELPDPIAALDALHRWPAIDRVLTSGGAGDWGRKAARLDRLTESAAPRITILAGGGVDAAALRVLARSAVTEAHVGRAARVPPTVEGTVSARAVAALVEAAR